MGIILAIFQSSGSFDVERDLRKIQRRYLLHHCAYLLKHWLGILSGPHASLVFRPRRRLRTPASVITSGSIVERVRGTKSGMTSLSFVKTEWKYWLYLLALSAFSSDDSWVVCFFGESGSRFCVGYLLQRSAVQCWSSGVSLLSIFVWNFFAASVSLCAVNGLLPAALLAFRNFLSWRFACITLRVIRGLFFNVFFNLTGIKFVTQCDYVFKTQPDSIYISQGIWSHSRKPLFMS